jgi:hypothetical protein
MIKRNKPLEKKCYGHIPHLPGSRMGPSDHKIHEGQARIATERVRDKHDCVNVTEKLDGSNVGVAKINNILYPLTKAGYIANTSPYIMHHMFYDWVINNKSRFNKVLNNSERICGEWLTHAHGTIYELPHEPFVVFDIFSDKNKRLSNIDFIGRVAGIFVLPKSIGGGSSLSIEKAMEYLGEKGFHGATEQIEGAVWRVERKGVFDFMCKYVKSDKIDGKYLKEDPPISNTYVF